MPITRDDVLHVAELARLALTDAEVNLYTAQIQRILCHVEKLSELDTGGVAPMTHAVGRGNPLREDLVKASIPREDALGCAPSSERGCFKVPKIIE
jgi:aspartyl-tRNA(Asn)/glutamyl-tRNA(Gln) amidotransferase subunit C